ncbi:MAG: hypothetical protein LWY06_14640, partial [Firmicutes bacterium]|nr:hypothetical protein [Bacillota bacterium]
SVLISAVECLDLRSGLQCWYFSEQDLIKLEVFRKNNGLILFRNFSVVCIDEKSGGLKWTFEPPGVDADSGLIQHGFSLTEDEFSQSVSKYIIVSADYYKIKNNEEVWKLTRYYILDPQNGKQIKHVDTVSISSSLQYVNGKLVLSCMNLEKSLLHLSYPK